MQAYKHQIGAHICRHARQLPGIRSPCGVILCSILGLLGSYYITMRPKITNMLGTIAMLEYWILQLPWFPSFAVLFGGFGGRLPVFVAERLRNDAVHPSCRASAEQSCCFPRAFIQRDRCTQFRRLEVYKARLLQRFQMVRSRKQQSCWASIIGARRLHDPTWFFDPVCIVLKKSLKLLPQHPAKLNFCELGRLAM